MSAPTFAPDLSDESRCVVTHWKLPVQCVLSPTHRDDHEAWHPESGNRIRFCGESVSPYTQELRHGEWATLYEPPITDLATAVEVMGALPMPAGLAAPKTLTPAREQQIRALEPAPPGLVGLGQAGSESEQRLYGRAVELHTACGELLAEIERLRAELAAAQKPRTPRLCLCGHSHLAHTVPAPHSCFAYGQTCPCPQYRQLLPDEAMAQLERNRRAAAERARYADEEAGR